MASGSFNRNASSSRSRSLRFGIEVFRVLQQQPARALEDLAFLVAAGLVIQLAAEGAELLVEQLDDVEVVEDMHRPGQVVAHRPDVGRRHVGGHGLDLGTRTPQPLPERLQGVGAFAVADEHDRPGEQVEDHGEVAVALADGDLIDGDLLELVQLGLAEAALEVAGLDVLDGVPTDLEVLGHVLDGHVPGQVQGITLEGTGVAFLGVGETDLHLADRAADRSTRRGARPGSPRSACGRWARCGRCVRGARWSQTSAQPHCGAAQAFAGLFDAEGHLASLEMLADIVVANDAEGVVQ